MAVLKENNTVAEINTSSLNKNKYRIEDFLHLLNLIAKFEIPTILSDDAHHISQLGQNYSVAYEMAKTAHISHFCRPALNSRHLFLKNCIAEKN